MSGRDVIPRVRLPDPRKPRRKLTLCDFCGRNCAEVRDHSGGHICRACDCDEEQSEGALHHACEWWIANGRLTARH